MASRLFDSAAGTWEVAALKSNVPAQHFWRAVTTRYAAGRVEAFEARDERLRRLPRAEPGTGRSGPPLAHGAS
ncbi:MAG: hypothetical protein ACREKB_11130, partial [Candidatus Rokuibacteriota bacterium]